jgi:hypothetical protein
MVLEKSNSMRLRHFLTAMKTTILFAFALSISIPLVDTGLHRP